MSIPVRGANAGQLDVTNLGDALTSWSIGFGFASSSRTITRISDADETRSGRGLDRHEPELHRNVGTNGRRTARTSRSAPPATLTSSAQRQGPPF